MSVGIPAPGQTGHVLTRCLDRQARLREDFMTARKDMDWAYSYNEPEFLSKEEADAKIAGLRKDARVKFGFEKADSEEEDR